MPATAEGGMAAKPGVFAESLRKAVKAVSRSWRTAALAARFWIACGAGDSVVGGDWGAGLAGAGPEVVEDAQPATASAAAVPAMHNIRAATWTPIA
jgi:hypothetical protein